MLLILYLASAIAGVLAFVYGEKEEYKKSTISTVVAMICGMIYIIATASKISKDLSEPNFMSVFGIVSLVMLLIAFLSGDIPNLLNYQIAAIITSALFCFFCSSINYSDYLVNCSENHDYVETIKIVTTFNEESIYGDGFVIGSFLEEKTNTSYYQYYFQDEEGHIQHNNILFKRTTITYINEDEAPFVEIAHRVNCMGFRVKSKEHVFQGSHKTYHLYIPKYSIKNITPTS